MPTDIVTHLKRRAEVVANKAYDSALDDIRRILRQKIWKYECGSDSLMTRVEAEVLSKIEANEREILSRYEAGYQLEIMNDFERLRNYLNPEKDSND